MVRSKLEDTVDAGAVNWGQTMTDEGNGFWIGHSYNRDRWLEGEISECRIWNKVLTADEINAKSHFIWWNLIRKDWWLTGSLMKEQVRQLLIIQVTEITGWL